jgi:hypothetical protein
MASNVRYLAAVDQAANPQKHPIFKKFKYIGGVFLIKSVIYRCALALFKDLTSLNALSVPKQALSFEILSKLRFSSQSAQFQIAFKA